MSIRKTILALLLILVMAACTAQTAEEPQTKQTTRPTVTVFKSPSCGCCDDWVAYLEEHGYEVRVELVQNLALIKSRYHVPQALYSCHTAIADGYTIEGHVPASDIDRLLSERPDIAGIAVAGMPIGSPGMEVAGAAPQPFEVTAFDEAGNTEVYNRYN